jgi:pyruvate,orthophosphate dikinase
MAKKTVRTQTQARKTTKKAARPTQAPRSRGTQYVFFFGAGKADGDRTMRDVLGGKGAGLAG